MNKTQILIVEDEGIVAKDLQAMLRRLGYHVPATVGTGELAIQTALQNQPDLILMDIQLRGSMDGVQASAAITSQQDVPILYLTANSDEATLQRAKATDLEAHHLSVRLELQADFLAGVWAYHAQQSKKILEPGDLEEALRAANAIGDDRLQKQGRGYVTPDSFTHGTSAQRVRWFKKGFESGTLEACNTFAER